METSEEFVPSKVVFDSVRTHYQTKDLNETSTKFSPGKASRSNLGASKLSSSSSASSIHSTNENSESYNRTEGQPGRKAETIHNREFALSESAGYYTRNSRSFVFSSGSGLEMVRSEDTDDETI